MPSPASIHVWILFCISILESHIFFNFISSLTKRVLFYAILTWARVFKVLLFGLSSTSLKSNFTSLIMLGMFFENVEPQTVELTARVRRQAGVRKTAEQGNGRRTTQLTTTSIVGCALKSLTVCHTGYDRPEHACRVPCGEPVHPHSSASHATFSIELLLLLLLHRQNTPHRVAADKRETRPAD